MDSCLSEVASWINSIQKFYGRTKPETEISIVSLGSRISSKVQKLSDLFPIAPFCTPLAKNLAEPLNLLFNFQFRVDVFQKYSQFETFWENASISPV